MSRLCYKDFPWYYDILYYRYLKTIPDFIDLVRREVKENAKILDLAAGTGEVSIPLLKAGYDVTSLDIQKGMLDVLEGKAKEMNIRSRTIEKSMLDIDCREKYDAVVIRQAINYLMSEQELSDTFNRIYQSIRKGGKFIFNAPNNVESSRKQTHNIYETDDAKAFVLEMNELEDSILTHRQYSIIWSDRKEPVYVEDMNRFRIYSKDEFEHALLAAGFRTRFLSSKMERYDEKDKTLYVVAEK